MHRPYRDATVLTLSLGYGVLWIAFVTTGDHPPRSVGARNLLLSAAASLLLMGVLFVIGLFVTSEPRLRRRRSNRGYPSVSTVVAAVVAVGALLGLLPLLRIVVWGGPAWLRWAIVVLATAALVVGSGRARVWALLGGLLWSLCRIGMGVGRDPTGRVDLLLTSWMVGATIGAVGGTLWAVGRDSGRSAEGRGDGTWHED